MGVFLYELSEPSLWTQIVTAPPGDRIRGVLIHGVDGQVVFNIVHPSRILSNNFSLYHLASSAHSIN